MKPSKVISFLAVFSGVVIASSVSQQPMAAQSSAPAVKKSDKAIRKKETPPSLFERSQPFAREVNARFPLSEIHLWKTGSEKFNDLIELLDRREADGAFLGAGYIASLSLELQTQCRDVVMELYKRSSQRLHKGGLDADYEARIELVERLEIAELSSALLDDIKFLPLFEWPEVWPKGWPTPGNISLVHRGTVGLVEKAVVRMGDLSVISKFHEAIESSDVATARVLIWAARYQANKAGFEWLNQYLDKNPPEPLRTTAIQSLNSLPLMLETVLDANKESAESMKITASQMKEEIERRGRKRNNMNLWE